MNYPKIQISKDKIKQNVLTLVEMAREQGIKVAGVTKVFCAYPEIAEAYVEGGVSFLADSRIENLKKMENIDIEKIMLRLPMISQAEDTVKYADISLNSEVATMRALSRAALKMGKQHKIILMVDLGDLREGYYHEEELMKAAEEAILLEGVELVGIGTNMTCYGAVIPKPENFDRLAELKMKIEEKYSIELDIVSGGNSSSIYLLEEHDLPINNLRLGESLVLGGETAYGKRIEGTANDAFVLQAEIIELKEKPSLPTGEIGRDAFGKEPSFIDRGVRKRAICAIGKQDVDKDSLSPRDEDIIILGASSDHLILDVSDSENLYKVGDIVDFTLDYGGILSTMTSEYVKKEII